MACCKLFGVESNDYNKIPGGLRMKKILSFNRVSDYVETVFGSAVHAKRRLSVTNAVFGIIMGAQLSITSVGRMYASVLGKTPKHAIKQTDRLVGNHLLNADWATECFARWLCASRPSLVVSLDWTVYDRDKHHTLALNLVTRHGRATPLLWKTYPADKLKGRRSGYEKAILRRLKRVIGSACSVTVLADRGFENKTLLHLIHTTLKWDYVIRLRSNTLMRCDDGIAQPMFTIRFHRDKPRTFSGVRLTSGRGIDCPTVVMVKSAVSKEPWYLATSLICDARTLIALYARRFTCEEQFRDAKDPRFGMGLEQSVVGSCERRDRLMLLNALATVLFTLIGAAGERIGYDRKLRANTVTKRTHSLFRQGREYMKGVAACFVEQFRKCFEAELRKLIQTSEAVATC